MSAAAIIAIIFSGIVAIILVSGLVNWGNVYFGRRARRDGITIDAAVLERLEQIERRLTDTQDVMLSLSDKIDRWDSEVSAPASTTGRSQA